MRLQYKAALEQRHMGRQASPLSYQRGRSMRKGYASLVLGLLLFHVQDEPVLSAWQSGEYYVDGTPKASLSAVRAAASLVHRGIAAACPGMALTPRIALRVGKPGKSGIRVTLTCSLDCNYTVTLDQRSLRGSATGRVRVAIAFAGRLTPGLHRATASALTPVNTGPPGSAARSFRSR